MFNQSPHTPREKETRHRVHPGPEDRPQTTQETLRACWRDFQCQQLAQRRSTWPVSLPAQIKNKASYTFKLAICQAIETIVSMLQ